MEILTFSWTSGFRKGGRTMTQNVNIAVKTESGQVKKISQGVIFQPETQFKGGSVKWFDDSKLIKPEYRK